MDKVEKFFNNSFFIVLLGISYLIPSVMIIKPLSEKYTFLQTIVPISIFASFYFFYKLNFFIYILYKMVIWIWGFTSLVINFPPKKSYIPLIIVISLYMIFFVINLSYDMYLKTYSKIREIREKVKELEEIGVYPPYKYIFRSDIYDDNFVTVDLKYFSYDDKTEMKIAIPENFILESDSDYLKLNLEKANTSERWRINDIINRFYSKEHKENIDKLEKLRKEIYR